MPFGTVYKIVFPNGKHYIGISVNILEKRKKEHKNCAKNGDTRCVYKALRKYEMVDTFDLIEIDNANTLEELYYKEINYIKEYNSYYKDGNGYNMTYGGEGINGYIYTEDDKQKMSKVTKKYFEENPEARKEMSEKLKKYFEENPEAGKKHSERLKKHFEENPEIRKEHSEKVKKYYEENPEAKKEHSEKIKKYFEENPEAKKEISERLKKYYKENPDAGKEYGEKIKKYYKEKPEIKKKVLDGRGKNKPFDIFTKDGIFIKTFTYQFEAIEYLKKEYNITSIINTGGVLSGKVKSSAGFVFKYK
jgi:hypothetical protein